MMSPIAPYAVPTEKISVRLVSLSGLSRDLEVFVRERNSNELETLLQRVNDPTCKFLPVADQGNVELVNLQWVSYIERQGLAPEVEVGRQLGMSRSAVEIELVSRERFRGELLYMLPAGRDRVSDYLNLDDDRFLLLATDRCTRYIHRQATVRVRFGRRAGVTAARGDRLASGSVPFIVPLATLRSR